MHRRNTPKLLFMQRKLFTNRQYLHLQSFILLKLIRFKLLFLPPNLLSCFGKFYFECNSCQKFLFNGLCYESCPIGFIENGENCDFRNNLILSFRFESNSDLLETVSNKFAYFNKSLNENYPFLLTNRGIYFPLESDCIVFENNENILLSPIFTISIWVKISQGSEVFAFESDDGFGIGLGDDGGLRNWISLNGSRSQLTFEGFLSDTWQHVLISVKNESEYFLTGKVNMGTVTIQNMAYLPYKDSIQSALILGGATMNCFIYSFEIFIFEPDIIFTVGKNCELKPYFEETCLSNCKIDEFSNSSSCEKCDEECFFGCINKTECIYCKQLNCKVCNNFKENDCLYCIPPYIIQNKVCKNCPESTYYNATTKNCEYCPFLCLSCNNINDCTSCVDNSSISKELSCLCNFGFERDNGVCSKLYFNAKIKIDSSNLISIYFSEELYSNSQMQNILITINSISSNYSLQSIDKTNYEISLIIDKDLIQLKNRKMNLTFPSSLISIRGSSLSQSSFSSRLFDTQISATNISTEKLKETAKSLAIASAVASLASGAILMNPTSIFNLLNLVELYSYSILYDLNYHQNFYDFIKSLKSSSKLPPLSLPIKIKDQKIPKKFSDFGIDSSLLIINAGYLITLITSLLIFTFISFLGELTKIPIIKSISNKIKKIIFYTWFHRTCIQGCFDLSIFTLLSFRYSSFNSTFTYIDFIFCSVITVIFIKVYIGLEYLIHFSLIRKIKFPLSKDELEKNYSSFSCLFQEFDFISWHKCMFNLIFMTRRIALSIAIVFCNGIIQLMVSLVFCMIVKTI